MRSSTKKHERAVKGAIARAASLSSERRREIALRAAFFRWGTTHYFDKRLRLRREYEARIAEIDKKIRIARIIEEEIGRKQG